jgi:hypothetical protein
MKSVLAFALVLASFVTTARAVEVCHRVNGKPGFVLIDVGDAAVPHHLAHGDTLAAGGTCPTSGGGPDYVFCGGFGSIPCDPGETCIDDPRDECNNSCGGADCGGICVTFPPAACEHGNCPAGFTCIDDPDDACNPECGDSRCATVCVVVVGTTCGGLSGRPCAGPDERCIDAPGDSCNPACGGADCGGICVVFAPVPCNGDRDCAAGSICVDDPSAACSRECDPACPQVCVTPRTR